METTGLGPSSCGSGVTSDHSGLSLYGTHSVCRYSSSELSVIFVLIERYSKCTIGRNTIEWQSTR